MANFKYVARNSSGDRREGVVEAISSNEVVATLRSKGLTPVSISEVAEKLKNRRATNSRKNIKSSDLAAFCWQLHTMLEGGIPITIALETMVEDIDNVKLRKITGDMLEKVLQGRTLSECMADYPEIFNTLSRSLVHAGESSGNMPQSLKRLADYYDNRDAIKKKVQTAIAYPIFVVFFVVAIVIFIMSFIVPRFKILFRTFGGELPAFTKAFMGFYEFTRANVLYMIIGLCVFVILNILFYKTKRGHRFYSKLVLSIPLIGNLLRYAFVTTFSRTMATLVRSGISILEIFEIMETMSDNDVIKDAVSDAREDIVEGENIADGLRSSGFFPNMLVRMMEVGENSGSISDVLDKTSNYYERKVETSINIMTTLLEPIMIITVGAIVLTVLLALYMPIFTYGT